MQSKLVLQVMLAISIVASLNLPAFQPVTAQPLSPMTVTGTLGSQEYFSPNPACSYPLNPYLCNEGPPVIVGGYLTTDASCTFLYDAQGVNYVVWNLPRHRYYPSGAYQVYGYVYRDWPLGQPFPPYPFQRTACTGVPLWTVPPYIQSYDGHYPSPCQNCWSNGYTVTVYGWLSSIGAGSGCVNLYTSREQSTIKSILWNVGSNYLPGYVAVTGVFQQMNPCGGTVLNVISIAPAWLN